MLDNDHPYNRDDERLSIVFSTVRALSMREIRAAVCARGCFRGGQRAELRGMPEGLPGGVAR
jgi:hypothetical protein